MKQIRFLLASWLLLAVAHAFGQSPDELVERYMAAYNDHDVAAMLELAHPDIQWLSIDGDEVQVVTEGHDALGEAMRGYFESMPSTRSEIETMMVSGNRVSVREIARWRVGDEWREQAAMSVYQIADGRIRRVWYFASE